MFFYFCAQMSWFIRSLSIHGEVIARGAFLFLDEQIIQHQVFGKTWEKLLGNLVNVELLMVFLGFYEFGSFL